MTGHKKSSKRETFIFFSPQTSLILNYTKFFFLSSFFAEKKYEDGARSKWILPNQLDRLTRGTSNEEEKKMTFLL